MYAIHTLGQYRTSRSTYRNDGRSVVERVTLPDLVAPCPRSVPDIAQQVRRPIARAEVYARPVPDMA
eukprot:420355-Rhodomonas_salina.3